MKKVLLILFLFPFILSAQEIQWANKVLKYSSDLGGKQNSVKRILGKPDVFPQGGPNANAWVAKDALGNGYVEVEFEKLQEVKQVAIFENLNAGCITRIMVGVGDGKYHTVARKKHNWKEQSYGVKQKTNTDRRYYFNKKRRKTEEAPSVDFNADVAYFLLEKPEQVKAIKVEFNFGLKPGQKQIDAIGISDSEEPINASINLVKGAELLNPETLVYGNNPNESLGYPFLIGETLFYYGNDYATNARKGYIYNLQTKTSEPINNKVEGPSHFAVVQGFFPHVKRLLMGYEENYTSSQRTGYSFFKEENGIYKFDGRLSIAAFSNYSEYIDCYITPDGNRVLFGIESDMTQGGNDLYTSTPKDDGSYSYLQNMGKSINTAGDEISPFLLSDNKTLLFASNGYSGYGDFDIYVTTRLDDTWKNWSEPRNLGAAVNGQSFDLNPHYDEKTETLYYVTFREGKSSIQKVKIPLKSLTEN